MKNKPFNAWDSLAELERKKRSKLESATEQYKMDAAVGDVEPMWKQSADEASDDALEIAKRKKQLREGK